MVICRGYMGIDFTTGWCYMVICRGYMGIDFTNWMVLYGDMSWLYGNRFHQLDGAIW